MFDQTFAYPDLAVIGLLILLEGVLSIDNALVLGLLAGRLPKEYQAKALTYGLIGAFAFRILAIGTASFLLSWHIVKLLGGGYLLWVALKHFWDQWRDKVDESKRTAVESLPLAGTDGAQAPTLEYAPVPVKKLAKFWPTVLVIELTDIAFAVDSILAAIALVGPKPVGVPVEALHPKLWVVITGGLLGVILMRFAAVLFIKLLERFPNFETAAYLLVTVIGSKLVIDYVGNDLLAAPGAHPVDFHSYQNPWFWAFWIAMILAFAFGFIGKQKATIADATIPQA